MKIRAYLVHIWNPEFLKTDNICVLTSEEGKYRVRTLAATCYTGIWIMQRESADIIWDHLKFRILRRHHIWWRQLYIPAEEEQGRKKDHQWNYKLTWAAFDCPKKQKKIHYRKRDKAKSHNRQSPSLSRIHQHWQIWQDQKTCHNEHQHSWSHAEEADILLFLTFPCHQS